MTRPFYADGPVSIWHGDALALPFPDASVDLIVTSPPYFALRSYTDDGEHYAGQLGSEPTPRRVCRRAHRRHPGNGPRPQAGRVDLGQPRRQVCAERGALAER
jgi:hypothetical protein